MGTPDGAFAGRVRTAAAAAAAAGVIVILAGFLYDVLFAGIPFQDPPPDIAAEYARRGAAASCIRLAGAGILSAGILVSIVVRIARPPGSRTR